VSEYKRKLFLPVEVLPEELAAFKRAFSQNVEQGWNTNFSGAYIPNGHGTSYHARSEGGNWHEEGFGVYTDPVVVFASGKPRIITKYSSYNTEVLFPLHNSLYTSLKRKGWLLVGEPTDAKVSGLNGLGPLMSYDYQSATDNIKADYVRCAIECLKEKAEGLTPTELDCLDVLGNLKFRGSRFCAKRGQPMGSMMSFPLLCLFNKTVVDLALLDLLQSKKISFNEWTSHRCLINGDDLLLRSPLLDHAIYDRSHRKWGSSVGLVVNAEKTMVSEAKGEVNSSLFINGERQKKCNLAALYMSGETGDVVRVAIEAATSLREFRRIVRLNAHLLARQRDKFPSHVPMRYRLALLGDHKIRRALRALPDSERPAAINLFPVVEKNDQYNLPKEEEKRIIAARVADLRRSGAWIATLPPCEGGSQPVWDPRKQTIIEGAQSLKSVYTRKWAKPAETVLSVLHSDWERKMKEQLWEEECGSLGPSPPIISDLRRIDALVDSIRAWKSARAPKPTFGSTFERQKESADRDIQEDFLAFE
jgi:hypothetical protein